MQLLLINICILLARSFGLGDAIFSTADQVWRATDMQSHNIVAYRMS